MKDPSSPEISHFLSTSDFPKDKLRELCAEHPPTTLFLEANWLCDSLSAKTLMPAGDYDLRRHLQSVVATATAPVVSCSDNSHFARAASCDDFPAYCHKAVIDRSGNFRVALMQIVKDPSPGTVFFEDESVLVVYDAYPKAKFHLLVLPKTHIEDLRALSRSHLQILEHMQSVARKIADWLCFDLTTQLCFCG